MSHKRLKALGYTLDQNGNWILINRKENSDEAAKVESKT